VLIHLLYDLTVPFYFDGFPLSLFMLYLISSIFELGTKVLVGCMGFFDGVLGEMADAAEFLKPWNNMSEKGNALTF